jgi:hypothetical protein
MSRLPPFPSHDIREMPTSAQEYERQVRDTKFNRLVKNVAGNVTVNLTSNESHNERIEFQGALTGNINVIVSTDVFQWTIFNNTSGAFTLTVKTLNGTGIVVGQGRHAILNCDGTNVLRITADT